MARRSRQSEDFPPDLRRQGSHRGQGGIQRSSSHALEGHCAELFDGKMLPLGFVQYIADAAISGSSAALHAGRWLGLWRFRQTQTVDAFNKVVETDDTIIDPDRIIYDPKRAPGAALTTARRRRRAHVPGAIYAGYSDPVSGDQISWGYLDDECDGIVTVTLAIGEKPVRLCAHRRRAADLRARFGSDPHGCGRTRPDSAWPRRRCRRDWRRPRRSCAARSNRCG